MPNQLSRVLPSAALLSLAFVPSLALAQSPGVTFAANDKGLTSLAYGGQQLLGYGDFRVNSVRTQSSENNVNVRSSAYDTSANRLLKQYDWGSIAVSYAAQSNGLNITVVTTNNSQSTITGVIYEPLGLLLPAAPAEFDGVTPMLATNIGDPSAVRLTAGPLSAVLVNTDVVKPLLIGYPWSLNKPTSTLFPLRIETARDNMLPDSLPVINRPIAPGTSDTYSLSLRFGPSSATTKSLASDVYASFASANPAVLSWSDHRPIGSLILATAAAGYPKNPRGWLLDSSLDVTTPEGVASFRTRVLAWAQGAVNVLKGMNAQGAVTWDIEGEQYPHATTYIGDPRQFATLAPEMAGVADDYFKVFTNAGLRVGVTLRPQQFQNGTQTEVADPGALLIDKIRYAKTRWGCTLFYIDSNGDSSRPTDAAVIRRVQAVFPDVLLMPEHKNTAYYAVSAPYAELRQGYVGTPSRVLDVYPNAFTLINTQDGPIQQRTAELRVSVQRGDLMMFRGWFPDSANDLVKSLYPATAPAPVRPPAIAITSPQNGAVVANVVSLSANATAEAGVTYVQWTVDGSQVAQTSAAPYAATWNSSLIQNGAHTIVATVRDQQGSTSSASVTLTVANAVPDTTPPTVLISSPAAGSTVSGNISITAAAADNIGVAAVRLSLDGVAVSSDLSSAPYTVSYDSTKLANGFHTVSVVARDAAGNSANAANTFTVLNAVPVAPPVISFLAPSPNATLAGSVTLSAAASSAIGIAAVRFFIDSAPIGGEITAAPYTLLLNSSSYSNGNHTLSAQARDTAGTVSTATVAINISNGVADTIPPTITLLSPGNNTNLSGLITFQSAASDNVGVARVVYYSDGVQLGTAVTPPYSFPFDGGRMLGGVHYLSAQAFDGAGNQSSANVSASISGPAPADCSAPGVKAFVGCYYSTAALTNQSFVRLTDYLNFDWDWRSPDAALTPNNFSVIWNGSFAFNPGNYRFELQVNGGVRLTVDGSVLLDQWTAQEYARYQPVATLAAGTHTIRVDYHNGRAANLMKMGWSPI